MGRSYVPSGADNGGYIYADMLAVCDADACENYIRLLLHLRALSGFRVLGHLYESRWISSP
jgi:hypothetical protein